MGGQAAPPPDYQALQRNITDAASKQTANNRLNTSNPFSSQTFGQDGSTSTQFTGGLGDAAAGLQKQAAGMATPLDWSQFGTPGNGDDARNQAINAAYGQATSRLDPQWNQRQSQTQTQLLNQGLDPNSMAYKNAMGDFSNQRNDAYTSAMNGAIGQGQAAGDSVFRNNLLSQQNAISNALRQRQLPMQEMQQMQGLLQQPGYNQDTAGLTGALGSAQFANQAYQQQQDAAEKANQEAADIATGGMAAAGGLGAAGILAFAPALMF